MTKSTPKTPAATRRRAPKISPDSAPVLTAAPHPKGKLGAIVDLMRRADGARLDEMMTATGWQAHSVRGAIAGAIKKKWRLVVTSEKSDDGRVYRITTPQAEV